MGLAKLTTLAKPVAFPLVLTGLFMFLGTLFGSGFMSATASQMGTEATEMGGRQMGQMGMDMMGMGADIIALAEVELELLPKGPLAWTALDLNALGSETTVISPALGFLYAHEGEHSAAINGEDTMLEPGQAVFVPQGAEVGLESGVGLWHIVLADPELELSEALKGAESAFSSGELEGLPEDSVTLHFLLVDLPMMGSATTVHTHPGPEYIYVSEGEVEYETGLANTETLTVADDRALPADTAVQKRNATNQPAAFLSWFVVASDAPFSPETTFGEGR